MWRIVTSELADQPMYRGQRLLFLNSVKAQIKSIYHHGRKVPSAFFGVGTKPIFRSESAQYVVFIQMSKEMWEFEPEGSGEIMFNKVIGGFLPELFTRWQAIGARHLLTIILFTRMEYDKHFAHKPPTIEKERELHTPSSSPEAPVYRDFYRVLVSDMASGQWGAILTQLKRDFKDFLRDISIQPVSVLEPLLGTPDRFFTEDAKTTDIVAGKPAPAARGNILEAINLASSQFSEDYIDRDLVRTGLSIVVITPGTGIFEVEADLLRLTTDLLIENGVSIDLVCLSRMPLHSIPLFKYKNKKLVQSLGSGEQIVPNTEITASMADSKATRGIRIPNAPVAPQAERKCSSLEHEVEEWHYAIPHWVDVSFWNNPGPSSVKEISCVRGSPHFWLQSFVPRVRMYEVQMMGVMENGISSISIPYLSMLHLYLVRNNNRAKSGSLQPAESISSLSSSFYKSDDPHPRTLDLSSTSFSPKSPLSLSNVGSLSSMIHWMDDYDDGLFRTSMKTGLSDMPLQRIQTSRSTPKQETMFSASSCPPRRQGGSADEVSLGNTTTLVEHMTARTSRPDQNSRKSSSASSSSRLFLHGSKTVKVSGQSNFGFRGFGNGALKAMPVTEVTSEVAHRGSLLKRELDRMPLLQTSIIANKERNGQHNTAGPVRVSAVVDSGGSSDSKTEQHSKPIEIKHYNKNLMSSVRSEENLKPRQRQPHASKTPISEFDLASYSRAKFVSLSKIVAPWMTVLNPSNPSLISPDPTARLGRWHHVFPRPLHTSTIKWKSLCSPASIPLTTEGPPQCDPSPFDLDTYQLSPSSTVLTDEPKSQNWLIRELISARFSHGFQVIVGKYIMSVFEDAALCKFDVFDGKSLHQVGALIYMSRGTQIHQLKLLEEGTVEVKLFLRRPSTNDSTITSKATSYGYYEASIRTPLSTTYEPRRIQMFPPRQPTNWRRLDTFIAGHEERQSSNYTDPPKFWRARFVFIPVQCSTNAKRTAADLNEDNDEETRLEGIYKLTQLWQRNRQTININDQPPVSKRKVEDLNPLDIIFRTRSASEVVASELHESYLSSGMNDRQPKGLLPESELLDQSSLNIALLAQVLQGERGIRMQDRLWHWRLHYNCFIGIELVTWLLENFRDVDSREEAVELGNMIMIKGLFVHVEKRHNFRDGNFFYQISPEYRIPRAENRSSWFHRLSSVPSTPTVEESKSSAGEIYSQPNDDSASDAGSTTPTEKGHRTKVILSKKLLYDADRRQNSYRREVFDLHYDRISSADDCYHVRIDWLNVTPKLIEDAITTWASAAERHGLRLVELPISEASKVKELHAFRSPYIVRLAKKPPNSLLPGLSDTASLRPRLVKDHPYQKALLRKFNFVLDMEAAKDFPACVDVSYSWGKPDYQYPQYISRQGVLLAQITDEGDFLLLANRLFNNRGATGKVANWVANNAAESADIADYKPRALAPFRNLAPSPRTSLGASPIIRAIPDVGPGMAKTDPITPESIKDEMEAFCADVAALENFYNETLEKAALERPQTPVLEGLGRNTTLPPALSLGRSLALNQGAAVTK